MPAEECDLCKLQKTLTSATQLYYAGILREGLREKGYAGPHKFCARHACEFTKVKEIFQMKLLNQARSSGKMGRS